MGLVGCLLGACQAEPGPAVEPGEMVVIPAGAFTMGSDGGPPASRPAHTVYLDEVRIDRTEVRIGDFQRFLTSRGLPVDSSADPDLPAVGMAWRLAAAYCQFLGRRLPTEAEWEKAARGTDGRDYPWGGPWDPQRANTASSGLGGPRPVDAYPEGASPYGVLNMSGNVAEWVADVYDPDYYKTSPLVDPRGPALVIDHVLRGGSWDSSPAQATTFFRDSSHSVEPNLRVGFRCASDGE